MPVLLLLVLVTAIAELWVLVELASVLGVGLTVLLVVAVSVLGLFVVRAEGLKAWRRLQATLAEGRVPGAEVLDGALLLLGGVLVLIPGLLTDAVGLVLLLPPGRRWVRGQVRRRARSVGHAGNPHAAGGAPGTIDVEVVRVQRSDLPPRAVGEGDEPHG